MSEENNSGTPDVSLTQPTLPGVDVKPENVYGGEPATRKARGKSVVLIGKTVAGKGRGTGPDGKEIIVESDVFHTLVETTANDAEIKAAASKLGQGEYEVWTVLSKRTIKIKPVTTTVVELD